MNKKNDPKILNFPSNAGNLEKQVEAILFAAEEPLDEISIQEKLRNKEYPIDIWLAFSPIKSNYSNFMVQKATELGVTKFIPIIFNLFSFFKVINIGCSFLHGRHQEAQMFIR